MTTLMHSQTSKQETSNKINKTYPKVSIVVPSYNRAEFLRETLNSLLKQNFQDFNIVFVDDGSTDDTLSIIKDYQKRYNNESMGFQKIQYVYQSNSERAVARSHGIKTVLAASDANQLSSEYICLVDSDDLWYPEKLTQQVAYMEAHTDTTLCYASVNRIDFDSKRLGSARRQHQGSSDFVFYDLLKRNFISSVTPMIRKSALLDLGPQVTDFIPYEDWDFWLRLSRTGKFHHITTALGDYRVHPGQSVQNVNAERIEEVTLKVLDANTKNLDISSYFSLIEKSENFNERKATEKPSQKQLEEEFQEHVNEAYSLAYLRIAYWYVLAHKTKTAQEKLKRSMEFSKSRQSDIRWYGIKLACYTGKLLHPLMAAFHTYG